MRISNGAGPKREKAPKPDLQSVLLHYGVDAPRSGNYNCAVHEETTPSMSVNLDEQVVQCFSCGFAGDAFSLIMEKEQVDFRGAVEAASKFEDAAPGGGREDVRSVLGRKRTSVPRNKGDRRSDRRSRTWTRPW